ncbi:NAD-dependent epimerase/dehydratase family protein [Chitinophagales bacterium]|nr:NAD-dependent epimerase/dehydratase family protein [Chitinophagales bacterium]
MSSKPTLVATVTGANGFVGSHLCERLIDLGYQVRAIVRSSSNTKYLDALPLDIIRCGLLDAPALEEAVRGSSHIYHLAGTTKALTEAGYMEGNVENTRRVMEACLVNPAIKKVVVTSSLAASHPSRDLSPAKEEDPSEPLSAYGRSKVAQEKLSYSYSDRIPVTVVRPPVIFGARDTEMYMLFQMVNSGLISKVGFQKKYISVIYIDDLVNGLIMAAEAEAAVGETFFLGSKKAYSYGEFSTAIAQALNKKTLSISVPHWALYGIAAISELYFKLKNEPATLSREKYKEMTQPGWICSSEKAERLLGFKEAFDLQQAVDITVQWYKENKWL